MSSYDPISLRPAIAELERLTSEMILWFKPQRMPLPVITIQSSHRDALGWFAWSRWESRDGGILDEINFVPEYLGRDLFDVAETLMHELVHLANYTAGIKDFCSNNYHNAKFRDRALAIGMTCERSNPYGWTKTGLTAGLRERIALLQPDARAFELFRLPPAPRKKKVVDITGTESAGSVAVLTRKKKLSKWTCVGECAPAWVASGKELQVECLTCGSQYFRAEQSDWSG